MKQVLALAAILVLSVAGIAAAQAALAEAGVGAVRVGG
jgi:hypothetical protein